MTLRDMDVLAGTDGHPLLVDHRRSDADTAWLPDDAARLALLDLIDPVTGEWQSIQVPVTETVPRLLHGIVTWPRPAWSCPFTPFGCRFTRRPAPSVPAAREELLAHLDRWHHHTQGVAA